MSRLSSPSRDGAAMVTVGVVIVNYRSWRLTARCLATLKKHVRSARLTLIVVDNSPESEVAELAAAHPEAVIRRPTANLGFAGGCNLGIAYALEQQLEYIQLLNPDTRIEHDFLAPLLVALAHDPHLGMAGPKIFYDQEERGVWYGGGEMRWWRGGPVQIFDRRNDSRGEVQEVPFLSGCAMLIRASVVKALGPMDEGYFLYYEDVDYAQRCLAAGYGVAYVPGAELLHAASTTVGFQSDEYIYYFSRNRLRFLRRWARLHHYLFYLLYNTLIKLPGALLVFALLRRRPMAAAAYFRGYFAGLRHKR